MFTPSFAPRYGGLLLGRVAPVARACSVIAAALLLGGCLEPSRPCLAELLPGDVVFTEIRGPQSGADTRGEWLELFNTTGEAIDLQGARINFRNTGGTQEIDILVRESLVIEAKGRVVLGSLADPPPEVDYSFNLDFVVTPGIEDTDGTVIIPTNEGLDPRSLFENAAIELSSCEELIDVVAYAELPSMGTYSLDGALTPSASNNDGLSGWCTDTTEAPPDGPQVDVGIYGTPGEANPPCPQ